MKAGLHIFVPLCTILSTQTVLAQADAEREDVHTWFMADDLECHISVATKGSSEASDYCKPQIKSDRRYGGSTLVDVEAVLEDLQQERKSAKRQVSRSAKGLRGAQASLRSGRSNGSKRRLRGLKKSISKLRSKLKNKKTSLKEVLGALNDLSECRRRGESICGVGPKPKRCTPEGCYGVNGTETSLNDAHSGHAELSPAVVSVGEVITGTAYPYDDRYSVRWPDLGDQIGECGPKSTSCSWRMTAATNGWREANFGIGGYFGEGSEEVAYMVLP